MFFRPSTQLKPATATAKVTFAELPSDGQNKENDQPVVTNEDPETETIGDKSAAPMQSKDEDSDDGEAKIIPWRAKLRKTNSTLNLLE